MLVLFPQGVPPVEIIANGIVDLAQDLAPKGILIDRPY